MRVVELCQKAIRCKFCLGIMRPLCRAVEAQRDSIYERRRCRRGKVEQKVQDEAKRESSEETVHSQSALQVSERSMTRGQCAGIFVDLRSRIGNECLKRILGQQSTET